MDLICFVPPFHDSGDLGTIHFETTNILHVSSTDNQQHSPGSIFNKADLYKLGRLLHVEQSCSDGIIHCKSFHTIRQIGILQGVNVVDTTGAGDAFIGGYLMAKLFAPSQEHNDAIQFALSFGAWVAGRKVAGRGARSGLPKGAALDEDLGNTKETIQESLKSKLSTFKCAI